MSAKLHLLSPQQCIVEHVVENLRDSSLEKLRRTLLVVPTQRLGTALLVRLLHEKKAVIPPQILTLESLIRSTGIHLPDLAFHAVAHDATIDLILAQRLAEHPYQHLRAGHERELRLLYGELHDHLLRDEGIERLKTTIAEDIYKNETHLGSLYDRAEEIAAIFSFLDQRLEALKLLSRTQYLARCAEHLAAHWQELTETFESITMLGFTSISTSWQPLLAALTADERVDLWLSEAPKLYHASSPLKVLLKTIQALGPELIPVRRSAIPEPSHLQCFVAQSIREEVVWAQKLVHKALTQGFTPSSIAILVTDENLYGTALRCLFEESPIASNIALPESWGGTLAGRHLATLLQFWREKQNLAGLLAWIDHPLTGSLWEAEQLQTLRRVILQAGLPFGLDAIRNELKVEFQEDFDRLTDPLLTLRTDQQLPLTQWLERLNRIVIEFCYWESFPSRDLMLSSQEVFEDFLASLRAFGHDHPIMSGQNFWDLLESHLLKGSIRGTGEPLAGIQIISLAEARYFPFEWVIIVGCHEGCFPKALPQDELLDNYLKKAMGLPGWEVLEAMEDQTFHLLRARLPHLVLLRSARLGEELLVRSRFTEALLARSKTREIALPTPNPFAITGALTLGLEGQLEDWLDITTARMSASRLDKLLHCPYSFLMESLGIQSESIRAEESDSRREGEWLHAVLQAFISGKSPRGKILPPWVPAQSEETLSAVKSRALERINTITDLMVPSDLRESALIQHLKTHAWPRYIEHHFAAMQPDLSLREYAFGQSHTPVTITLRGSTRELHGRIDALDFAKDSAFVTDYKRRTIPSLDKSKKGLNAQLSLYALALQQNSPKRPLPPLVLGYWNIYQGVWTAHGIAEDQRSRLLGEGLCTKGTPTAEHLTRELLASWRWREEEIVAARHFYADPGQCQLCDYAGLCRKDDPRVRDRIAAQDRLAQRQEEQDV